MREFLPNYLKAMAIALHNNDELCPNCGEFVPYLHEETGFCYSCSGIEPARRCLVCNDILGDNSDSNECSRCKYIGWLERNADTIERVMATNRVKASKAKRLVLQSNRPICLICKNPIKGGQLGKHFFCRTTALCRRGSNVYRYHRTKNRPHEEAVKKAIEAAYILKLTGGING